MLERRGEIGLMKAIGGATRRVVRLFLAEAALLGLGGGLIGAALGILLGTIAATMGQFGLLAVPVILVMMLLSGAMTPMESMPVPRAVSLAKARVPPWRKKSPLNPLLLPWSNMPAAMLVLMMEAMPRAWSWPTINAIISHITA